MTREEAIDIVRKNYPHVGVSGSQFETALRNLIPELRESEDERIRKALIEFLREAYSRGNAPEECAKWLVWLDWHKEQKPAEWSEEDEDNLKAIIRIIEDNDSDWKELTDWLKSLRPQPKQGIVLTEEQEKKFGHLFSYTYWKPSKEQMSALNHCAYGTCRIDDKPALQELYEQLKKM